MKVVIVGGVAGGATAAARLRRLDEKAEIVVLERSGFVSYANCGLPYYIGGVIEDQAELTLQTPESFYARFRVRIKVHHEVTAIDRTAKTVTVHNLETGETFAESYDKLLLAPGAQPTRPPLPGVELDRLFTLRTVEDTLRIRRFVEEQHPRSAVLAGGGFIGLELAENLRELGLDVTIVQRPKHLMNPFDPDMAALLHAEVRAHGVHLALGHTVEGFTGTEKCRLYRCIRLKNILNRGRCAGLIRSPLRECKLLSGRGLVWEFPRSAVRVFLRGCLVLSLRRSYPVCSLPPDSVRRQVRGLPFLSRCR